MYAEKHRSNFYAKAAKRFSLSDKRKAKKAFNKRTLKSRKSDLTRLAKIAPNIQIYIKNPVRYDFPYVDTPNSSVDQQLPKEQVQQITKIAANKPAEVIIRDTNQPKKKHGNKKIPHNKKTSFKL
jgi:hypothetical protein